MSNTNYWFDLQCGQSSAAASLQSDRLTDRFAAASTGSFLQILMASKETLSPTELRIMNAVYTTLLTVRVEGVKIGWENTLIASCGLVVRGGRRLKFGGDDGSLSDHTRIWTSKPELLSAPSYCSSIFSYRRGFWGQAPTEYWTSVAWSPQSRKFGEGH